jgi:hypothetical protein
VGRFAKGRAGAKRLAPRRKRVSRSLRAGAGGGRNVSGERRFRMPPEAVSPVEPAYRTISCPSLGLWRALARRRAGQTSGSTRRRTVGPPAPSRLHKPTGAWVRDGGGGGGAAPIILVEFVALYV